MASVQQQVAQAQAQWQRQATQFDVSSLGNAVSGLTALLGQFNQALQQLSVGAAPATAPGAAAERVAPQAAVATNTNTGAVAGTVAAAVWPPKASRLQAASNTELWGALH